MRYTSTPRYGMRTMKITHSAFDHPLMSWLRKMSLKTTISNQIQMKNRKNQSIDRKTCPVPKSEASGIFLLEMANGTESEDTPTPPAGASPNRGETMSPGAVVPPQRETECDARLHGHARGRVGDGDGPSAAARPPRGRDSRAHRGHDTPSAR